MKKIGMALLCLVLLSGCGKAERGAALQEQYAALSRAELTAEITCHLPEENRQFQVTCQYNREGDSDIVVTAPAELAGLQATVSGEDLTLTYDDLVLPAGSAAAVSPASCLPWLMRAASAGYILEEGRETLGDKPCLRLTLDTTGQDGEKVLCTAWFDQETQMPVYGEFAVDGQLLLSVDIIQFTAEAEAPTEQ